MGDMTLIWRVQEQEKTRECRVFVFEDISAQAALEASIQKMKAEFANREKLVSIGQLTAGLAHEINNPLGYLKSDVRSLERIVERKFPESDDKDVKEIISISEGISEGLDQIGKVVSTLLAFSRQGSTNVPPESFNLHEGIDAMLEIMRVDWRDIADIRKDYGAIPEIFVCRHEINQVIFNILKNALQAIRELSPQEGRRGLVQIRTGFGNDRIWCEIENNGPPISEAAASRIFDLFFTTKRELLGTGLGLNYSRDIIEHRNHGKLFLASRDPVVFRMELPAGKSD
jgi:signal transduction histidine kinase